MLTEEEALEIYISSVKSIINGDTNDSYNRGYVEGIRKVLELSENAWMDLIKNK